MKFLLSSTGKQNSSLRGPHFLCVETQGKKGLSEPVTLTLAEVLRQIQKGEEFHWLYRVGCRWEVGSVVDTDTKIG